MERIDAGQEYWVICRRFNQWKAKNPSIREAAVSDMIALRPRLRNAAVIRRVNLFIAHNQGQSPGNHGGNGGGKRA